ncbi:MAG: hypothetical protein M3N51_10430 [Actinomycetota bacterium]|nr:hypothetical protein [Actinomycetota bacterium]
MAAGPNLHDLWHNWRTFPAPWHHKLRLLARNSGIRFHRRSLCCGHPGQPGC